MTRSPRDAVVETKQRVGRSRKAGKAADVLPQRQIHLLAQPVGSVQHAVRHPSVLRAFDPHHLEALAAQVLPSRTRHHPKDIGHPQVIRSRARPLSHPPDRLARQLDLDDYSSVRVRNDDIRPPQLGRGMNGWPCRPGHFEREIESPGGGLLGDEDLQCEVVVALPGTVAVDVAVVRRRSQKLTASAPPGDQRHLPATRRAADEGCEPRHRLCEGACLQRRPPLTPPKLDS